MTAKEVLEMGPMLAQAEVDLTEPTLTDAPRPPSQNVTINLINRLVQRGVLSREDAEELIRQAEADTQAAHAKPRPMRVPRRKPPWRRSRRN